MFSSWTFDETGGGTNVSCFLYCCFIHGIMMNNIPVTKLMSEWRQTDYTSQERLSNLSIRFYSKFSFWFSTFRIGHFRLVWINHLQNSHKMLSKVFVISIVFFSLMSQSQCKSINLPSPQCRPSVIDTMPQRVRKICEALGTIWEFSDAMNNYLDEKGTTKLLCFPLRLSCPIH